MREGFVQLQGRRPELGEKPLRGSLGTSQLLPGRTVVGRGIDLVMSGTMREEEGVVESFAADEDRMARGEMGTIMCR